MTTIYLDAGALMVAGGAAAPGTQTVGSDADRMVSHLLSFGHQVVLLGEPDKLEAARASLPIIRRVPSIEASGELAEVEETGGWLVSDSADRCARMHRRLKTVLVGSSTATHDLAHRPADRLARSLTDAVLDILATEAMPDEPATTTAAEPVTAGADTLPATPEPPESESTGSGAPHA